jgi:predicted membrane protein
MKKRNLMGLILVALGAVLLLQAFDIIQGTVFFDGWWTLFLIIPAIVSMSRTGVSAGNTILLVLGVGFLLQEQGWNFKGYLVPAIFIILGIGILFRK